MFRVRDLKLKSDVSKVTNVWLKKSFSCSKLKVTSTKKNCLAKTKHLIILYDLYNYLIYIIINPLHTINFSLTVHINNFTFILIYTDRM